MDGGTGIDNFVETILANSKRLISMIRPFRFSGILIMLMGLSLTGTGQWKDYIIGVKGDTLNRVDQKNQKQGPWIIHFDEVRGEPGYEEEGIFKNDKKEGVWRRYNLQGDLIAIENYRWGNKDGAQQYYTMFGDLIREESWRAINPENQYDTVPVYDLDKPDYIKEYRIVKVDGYSYKHGKWKFYDPPDTKVVKSEMYFMDKLQNGDEIAAKATEEKKKEPSKTKEILEYEKKNSHKKKIKVRTGETGGG
ncbi:MAG: hypothetical protein EKK37_12420 [Sphingobacteriales bacterium]|nr:MAG: hypothetical protein EKK37_12420 [Sphingobacteriales bacterium]